MRAEVGDPRTMELCRYWIERLRLPTDALWVTDRRATYAEWLGRPVPSAYGGAYCFLPRRGVHAVLINRERIDLDAPRALEIVVCEELVHMRDYLDGDRRRHSHHGHDRIAHRVAALTGASLDEIRTCLRPVQRRAPRYVYECPRCRQRVRRRVRGTWSCGTCAPEFRRDLTLRLVADDDIAPAASG